MSPQDHFSFIFAAYAAAAFILAVLIGWIALDYRALKRQLAELEKRGMTRRSGGRSS